MGEFETVQLCKPQTVGCLENDDLEYDDLESKDLENDDLENLELQGRTGMGWVGWRSTESRK